MNLFRPIQTAENKKLFKAEIIAEKDDGSNYPEGDEFSEYENSSKKAAEMETILGNALAMTERSNGSIHSLQRSGTNSAIEIGRRIATMYSRENMAISDAHLENNDSFSYISRTSSLGSVVSLPTFVKVDREDPIIFAQQSWDNTTSDNHEFKDEQKSSVNTGYESASHRSFLNNTNAPESEASKPKVLNRSWNKLRREVDGEARAMAKEGDEMDITPRRIQSIGSKVLGFRKKVEKFISSDPNNKNTRIREGYAKDYDVEVSLRNRKKKWVSYPSIIKGGKSKKAASTTAFKSKRGDNTRMTGNNSSDDKMRQKQTNQLDADNSFDTPTTDVEDSSQTPVEETMVERKPNVVVKMHEIHKGDLIFQALEVACCHPIDGETLDLITDLVPPQV